jgi:hypothetical protein
VRLFQSNAGGNAPAATDCTKLIGLSNYPENRPARSASVCHSEHHAMAQGVQIANDDPASTSPDHTLSVELA